MSLFSTNDVIPRNYDSKQNPELSKIALATPSQSKLSEVKSKH